MDYPLGCVGELLPSDGRGLISGTISDIGEFTQIRDGSQTLTSEKFASHDFEPSFSRGWRGLKSVMLPIGSLDIRALGDTFFHVPQ
jgi:hypothetical protein